VQNQTSTHYVVDTYNNLYLLLNLIVKILSHYNNYLMGIVTSRQLITFNKLKIFGSSSNLHGGNPALFMSGPAFQYFALLPLWQTRVKGGLCFVKQKYVSIFDTISYQLFFFLYKM
jgi:hypothetical protein